MKEDLERIRRISWYAIPQRSSIGMKLWHQSDRQILLPQEIPRPIRERLESFWSGANRESSTHLSGTKHSGPFKLAVEW
jgi:hypothetical protein